jgi:cytochrome c556
LVIPRWEAVKRIDAYDVFETMTVRKLLASLVIFACFAPAVAHPHPDAKGIVKERMATMKALASSMKALNQVRMGQTPISTAIKIGEKIIGHSRLIPEQFPASTYDYPSEASPKIDSARMLFKKQASDLRAAASAMIEVARGEDLNDFTSSFRNIGKACSSCHKGFRLKRQRWCK